MENNDFQISGAAESFFWAWLLKGGNPMADQGVKTLDLVIAASGDECDLRVNGQSLPGCYKYVVVSELGKATRIVAFCFGPEGRTRHSFQVQAEDEKADGD